MYIYFQNDVLSMHKYRFTVFLLCILFGSLADFDTLLGGEVGGVEFGKLPFGACEEPIR